MGLFSIAHWQALRCHPGTTTVEVTLQCFDVVSVCRNYAPLLSYTGPLDVPAFLNQNNSIVPFSATRLVKQSLFSTEDLMLVFLV